MEILPDAAIRDLGVSGHVCWLVSDPGAYDGLAAALLAEGDRLGQQCVAFGPGAADAGTPAAIMDLIRELATKASADGYCGLRVVADMDCILPLRLSTADIVAFELQLDRLLGELNATVVCAYRRSSFDTRAIVGALAVHPEQFGSGPPAPFRFVAGPQRSWRLSGEVDMTMQEAFAAAVGTAATLGDCVIDVTDLSFIDISGMRAIAHGALTAGDGIRLHGASADLRRLWDISGFKDFAPKVQLSLLRARSTAAHASFAPAARSCRRGRGWRRSARPGLRRACRCCAQGGMKTVAGLALRAVDCADRRLRLDGKQGRLPAWWGHYGR